MRITPDNITHLGLNQIFVFGSNLSGYHSKGAALTAMKFGAIYRQAYGLQGKTYGIPTKSFSVRQVLTLAQINVYVNEFICFAALNYNMVFLVTEIGCGLAGYKPKDIAPLFKDCINLENVYLPQRFIDVIKNLK